MNDERLIAAVRSRARASSAFCTQITNCLLQEFDTHSNTSKAKLADLENRDRVARVAGAWKEEPIQGRAN